MNRIGAAQPFFVKTDVFDGDRPMCISQDLVGLTEKQIERKKDEYSNKATHALVLWANFLGMLEPWTVLFAGDCKLQSYQIRSDSISLDQLH